MYMQEIPVKFNFIIFSFDHYSYKVKDLERITKGKNTIDVQRRKNEGSSKNAENLRHLQHGIQLFIYGCWRDDAWTYVLANER